ncbi:MAG: ABC-2 transporter permease [Lachnospiraceae bacterium]|nr:ABC-2 transporter permease [Lachnospiraceae bacterium]
MKKYKSLLFREYKLSRNHYLFRLVILLLFLGLVFLTLLLNHEESQETKDSITMFMSLLFAMIAGFVCADDDGVYKSDINVGWHTYSYCLPVSLWEKVIVRYLVKVFAILVGAGITALGCQIIASGAGTKVDMRMICVFLLIADIYLLFQIIIDLVSLMAKDAKESKKFLIIFAVLVLGIIVLSPNLIPADLFDMSGDELGVILPNRIVEAVMKLIDKLDLFVLPLLIVLFAAGFGITYKIYERRKV